MKTEKRMACFIVSAALLIVTLWFTSCSSTSADAETKTEAETADHPCYHVTVYSRQLKKLAMPVGVSRSTPLPWRTSESCCRNHTLAESSITCSASLWKMDVLSWCPPRWWKSSITEGRDVRMKAVLLSMRPVEITRPPQGWRYVEELSNE